MMVDFILTILGVSLIAVIGWCVLWVIGNWVFGIEREELTEKWDDNLPYLSDATVTDINGHTKEISAKGRTFVISVETDGSLRGKKYIQEKYNNGRRGSRIFGAENAVMFGKADDEALAEHLRWKIANKR